MLLGAGDMKKPGGIVAPQTLPSGRELSDHAGLGGICTAASAGGGQSSKSTETAATTN